MPPDRSGSLESSAGDRLAFGARLAALQGTGRSAWTFYSHLSLAKVQRFVPGRRRPYMVFLHGIEAWRSLTPTESRVLAGASLRVANSAYTADRVRQRHPDVGSISVCPLAVPPAWGPSTATPANRADRIGARAVVIVARMAAGERYKGHDALLAAWPAVLARQPDAQLVVVGSGDDETRLRAKAQDLGAGVIFTGFVDDAELAAIYARAAVFAMPSRGEGFGIAYLEAMAHGLPCIGSVHDAAGEVIDDGVTGYLVDQADTQALADRISSLLGDEARRRAMGEAGRRRLHERFTPDGFERRLGNLLEETLTADTPLVGGRAGRTP